MYYVSTIDCAELMAKGGALFTGVNELNEQEETIVCYYTMLLYKKTVIEVVLWLVLFRWILPT